MADYDKDKELMIRLDEQLKSLRTTHESTNKALVDLQKDMSEMKGLAKQWRGGILVVVAIGGIIAWFSNIFTKWAF